MPRGTGKMMRLARDSNINSRSVNWLLLVALLTGVFFRWSALGPMNDMLHHDEAYNGVDALSILHDPRLVPFFPGNFGRESGWIYCLVPFLAVFGAQPSSLRLAAIIAGILTLVAVYRLGREVVGERPATWTTAVLAVFYWPVHLNHLALRANLFPLIGALAFALLFRAQRTNKGAQWIIAGALLGLLMYTYYSARLWMVYGFILLGWWILSDPQRRKGSLLALCAMAAVCLPMIAYSYANPQLAVNRIGMVATLEPAQIRTNLELWAQAWFQRGDPNAERNLPGRPILDPAHAILFLTGVTALLLDDTRRRVAVFILGLGLFSVVPSLLSDQAPHFLRAIGLTVPIALVAGVGAWTIEGEARRMLSARIASVLPFVLLTLTSVASYRDFHIRWLQHPEVPILMEEHINQAINFMKDQFPAETTAYFSPFSLSHPVLVFRRADLMPRQIGAFDSHYCMVIPDASADYFSLTMYEPGFEQGLSHWADLTVLHQEPMLSEDSTMYTLFRAETHPDFSSGTGLGEAVFADAIRLRLLLPISSAVHAGEVVPVSLALKALRNLGQDYSVFVHLHGDPTPYEGGALWAQGDSQACASYPSRLWRTNETIVQDFVLDVPADIPPGMYTVAAGIYESPAGARLPLSWPEPQPDNFFELQDIQVVLPRSGS
jgi:hypothetical protein